MSKPTMHEIAQDSNLWGEYVDPHATMTEKEFNAMTVDEKVKLQREMYPHEAAEEDAARDASK